MTVELNYVIEGPTDAPVLVLGNSLGTGLAMWALVAERLGDRFRILRYDHRGQGGSPVPDGPYVIADVGGDVLALLDALSISRAVYAGVSVGGMVALWLAANAPDRIHRVAVFNSSAHPGGPDAWHGRAETVRSADSTAPVAEAVVGRWITPAFAERHPEVRASLLTMLRASPPTGYAALCDMLAELDLRPDLERISMPALVVGGAQDEALPPSHSELIAAGIPGAHHELLDPSAHIPMAERPDAVAALIRDHLGE